MSGWWFFSTKFKVCRCWPTIWTLGDYKAPSRLGWMHAAMRPIHPHLTSGQGQFHRWLTNRAIPLLSLSSIGLLLEIWMRPMQDTRTRSLPLCFIPQLGWHARHPYFACSSRRSWRPMREISWTTCCWYISLSPCLQFLGHKFVVFSIINIIVDSFVYVVMDTCLITKVLHSVGDCKKASCCGDNISRENEQYIYESS